jgi:hypothetical protein
MVHYRDKKVVGVFVRFRAPLHPIVLHGEILQNCLTNNIRSDLIIQISRNSLDNWKVLFDLTKRFLLSSKKRYRLCLSILHVTTVPSGTIVPVPLMFQTFV